jgi:hypothetical protein
VRTNPNIIAAVTTVLFSGTLGALIAVAGFGVLRIGEQMLEAVGVLPLRWGENNVTLLMAIAGVLSLPAVAWFGAWFFRKAAAGERRLDGYKYTPPS